jgi:hypothetical protein
VHRPRFGDDVLDLLAHAAERLAEQPRAVAHEPRALAGHAFHQLLRALLGRTRVVAAHDDEDDERREEEPLREERELERRLRDCEEDEDEDLELVVDRS